MALRLLTCEPMADTVSDFLVSRLAARGVTRIYGYLNAGSRVAMLVGAGALQATDEVVDVAEALGAGIAKALLGKAAVPDDYPFVTGSIGRDAAADVQRVAAARAAIGADAELFVDANGAYTRKEALAQAYRLARQHVTWFEEPVSSDDLAGLALMVRRAPPAMNIAAGEYG